MSDADRHDPYVCTGCGKSIPPGSPHGVIGFSTVCRDCYNQYCDTATDRSEDGR